MNKLLERALVKGLRGRLEADDPVGPGHPGGNDRRAAQPAGPHGPEHRQDARQAEALAAIARSVLVIIFHLLADPEARFYDLGPGYYYRISRDRKIHNYVRQLEALGLTVTVEEAA